MEYNAMIELDVYIDRLTDDETVALLEPIGPHHGALGRSDTGRVQLTITVDALDAIDTLRIVHDLMQASYASYRVNSVDVMLTSMFDAIYGLGHYFG
ncbi:hypothetical protein OED52_16455 [Rhodococcus sp. Z13]|uniref:Uncharacterized protein n=1 Tax=Rhodococcus sacchari TaxID=2962047 RepID=A0ACD4DDX6_9NOCA|nr:hypothetical protein [Rhodococcus sp. Z13]UYP18234.1 hypothetical protein OED52_16455 [Rhodococcus sp. Z13]